MAHARHYVVWHSCRRRPWRAVRGALRAPPPSRPVPALSSRWRTGTPRSTQARRATHAVNFYAGGHLNRASWLRESAAYLNKALVRPDTRFVLLSQGNPLVRRNDASQRIALFQWKDVERTVLDTVRRVASGATSVFGPEAYALQKRADADEKHWTRTTQAVLAPALSLAYLGVLEDTNAAPTTESFGDSDARALVVPSGPPYFALSLSYRPPGTPEDTTLPGAELLRTLTDEHAGAHEELHMRTVVLTGALDRDDAAIVANARALLDWNEQYAFCAGCGSRQYSVWGGHKRACASVLARVAERAPLVDAVHPAPPPSTVCNSVLSIQNYSYPRSDPVIIVGIVSADQEHVLLGRQKTWPKGMYSCIAYVLSTHPAALLSRASRSRTRCAARRSKRRACTSSRSRTTARSPGRSLRTSSLARLDSPRKAAPTSASTWTRSSKTPSLRRARMCLPPWPPPSRGSGRTATTHRRATDKTTCMCSY